VAVRSPLLPIFLIVVVDILGMTIILPLLPFYAEHFGASPSVVGLLVSTYAACQLVAGPLLGRISDRIGRKPLLIVSQLGTFVGFLILAGASSLWMVFLGRVVDGITAGNLSLAQAYIADVTAPKDRAKSFAVIGIAFGIGFLIGPALSGFLSQYSFTYPILAAAGLSATSVLCTTFLLPRNPPVPEGMQAPAGEDAAAAPAGRRLALLDWGAYVDYFRKPGLAPLLAQFFCFCFGFSCFNSGFALFAERRFLWDGARFGPKEVGYVLAFAGFLGIILQGGLVGRLVKRFGEEKILTSAQVAGSVGYTALGFAQNVPALLSVTAVSSYGTGLMRPVLTSLITQRVARNEQGTVLGLTQSLQAVSQIIAPAIAGALIDREHLLLWAVLAASAYGVGLTVNLVSEARRRVPSPGL
jgi:MFS family permease